MSAKKFSGFCFSVFLLCVAAVSAESPAETLAADPRSSLELFNAIDPALIDEMGGLDGSSEAQALIARGEKMLPALETVFKTGGRARKRLVLDLLTTLPPGLKGREQLFRQAVMDPDPVVRMDAVGGLHQEKSAEARRLAQNAFRDKDDAVRSASVLAVTAQSFPEFRDAVRGRLSDPVSWIRRAAARKLAESAQASDRVAAQTFWRNEHPINKPSEWRFLESISTDTLMGNERVRLTLRVPHGGFVIVDRPTKGQFPVVDQFDSGDAPECREISYEAFREMREWVLDPVTLKDCEHTRGATAERVFTEPGIYTFGISETSLHTDAPSSNPDVLEIRYLP
jgi:hypothetical protein